jgi:membrane dipeptidase
MKMICFRRMKRLRWLFLPIILIVVAWLLPGIVERRFNHTLHAPPHQPSAQAEDLHRKLTVVDLHADSLLWGRNLLHRSSTGHVDVPRLAEGNVSIQAFTVVTTSPRKLNIYRNSDSSDMVRYLAIFEGWPPRTWNSPKQRALYQAERLNKFAAQSGGGLVLIRSRSDLQQFLIKRGASRAVAGFLGAEGAQPLEGDLKNLDDLYSAGFRMMAPTHFTDTAIGGSASGMDKAGTHRSWPPMGSRHGSPSHDHRPGTRLTRHRCATSRPWLCIPYLSRIPA